VRRMSAPWVLAIIAASALVLTGCAFGPEPRDVAERTAEVFDELSTELAAADPALVRTVEIVDTDDIPCDDDRSQSALVAQGTLSVRAEDGAAAGVIDTLAALLDAEEWAADDPRGGDVRSWSNDLGITVTLSDASPLVVVAVFGPCLAPIDAAG
jgi:hypothetical protein